MPADEHFDVKEELKKLPDKPGVYLMHDADDTIIYVGKAINLRNRVRSYFRPNVGRGPWIDRMISLIDWFEYIVTDSELEALVLENNLIKEYRPKYNTMLTDDKTYPYIKVTVQEEYPRVLFSREMKKDKARYFGPYTSAGAVKSTIELMNRIYQLRTCNRNLPRDCGQKRPCLNYHIHQCMAPCNGTVKKEQYRERVEAALDFLNGNYSLILKDLDEKMKAASEALDFEEAIHYRDLYSSVKQVAQKQKITDSEGEDRDVIALASQKQDAVVQVFFVRGGKLIGREHFYMKTSGSEETKEILQSFLKQFYSGTPFIPKDILLQEEIEEADVIEEWLTKARGGRVHLLVPQKGTKEKLVEMAAQNALLVLQRDKERIRVEERKTTGAVSEVASWLSMEHIVRMEAFDISNISGFENVGSMVVYENGKPKRSDYRKFRIRSIQGPDDYGCMREVLSRRFLHGLKETDDLKKRDMEAKYGSFTKFPDLILMDGGRGQVNIAEAVLKELNLNIPVCGMVKDDSHRTRGLYYHNEEIPISRRSEGFFLITRIQDEAHRFAIEYHRSLRSKEQVHSILDDINHVGPARRKALMKHFKNLKEIQEADVDTLSEVPGIPLQVAQEIYSFFHGSVIE